MGGGTNAGGGARSQCWASGLGCDQGARPSPGPGPGGGVDDSHLQQPRGLVAVAAAQGAGGCSSSSGGGAGHLQAAVSVGQGWVGGHGGASLTEVEEDMEVWCWWCCWGLLLTVAPVLWTLTVP